MITKAHGKYDLIVNDVTVASTPNILVRGYFNTPITGNPVCVLSSSGDTPTYADTVLTGVISSQSGAKQGSSTAVVVGDTFETSVTYAFAFATGLTGFVRNIGVSCPALFSHARLTRDGQPIEVELQPEDVVKVAYTLTYVNSLVPQPIEVNILGSVVTGTMLTGGYASWNAGIARAQGLDGLGLEPADTIVFDEDGNGVGLITERFTMQTVYSNGVDVVRSTASVLVGAADANKTFQQIILMTSSAIAVIINLDTPVTKTNQDLLELSFHVDQEGI